MIMVFRNKTIGLVLLFTVVRSANAVRSVVPPFETSSWIDYATQIDKFNLYGKNLSSICVFSYGVDTNGTVAPLMSWVPSTVATLMANRKPGQPVFITFVSGTSADDGTNSNTDPLPLLS